MASANSPIPSGGQPPIATGGGANFDIIQWLQQAVQQLNTPQSGGNSQGGMAVSQQRMGGGGGQPQKPQANAYQKGVDKALNESGYAHASEALMKGQDPMMIAQQSSQMGMQQANANMIPLLQNLLAMAQQPQQQMQQPMQQQMTPIQQQAQQISQPTKNPVMGALDAVFGIGTNYKSRQLENLGKAQEIMGEQPLQKGRKEELTYTFANEIQKELLKEGNPDALTPEASAKFNLIIDGDKAVQEVASILQTNPNVVWSTPSFLKSQQGRQYESAVKRMIRNKLRLESGATIGDKEINEEYAKYRVGKTDSQETIRKKLNPLYEFYQGSLNVADPTGVHRKRASGGSGKETTIGRFQVRYH